MGLTAPHLEAISCARASAGVIYGVLDRKPEIDSLGTDGSRPNIDGDIELHDVYFSYPARPDVQVRIHRDHCSNPHLLFYILFHNVSGVTVTNVNV